ncbi:hypothetical protein PSEUDO8AS_40063 [Pseudomonas sp. 8AS]|nr:hypothetical protein PSEUDO8AS_40063 [Pseudomonas sp. 8AS]
MAGGAAADRRGLPDFPRRPRLQPGLPAAYAPGLGRRVAGGGRCAARPAQPYAPVRFRQLCRARRQVGRGCAPGPGRHERALWPLGDRAAAAVPPPLSACRGNGLRCARRTQMRCARLSVRSLSRLRMAPDLSLSKKSIYTSSMCQCPLGQGHGCLVVLTPSLAQGIDAFTGVVGP